MDVDKLNGGARRKRVAKKTGRRAQVGPLTVVPARLTRRKVGRPSKKRVAQRAQASDIFVPHVGRPRASRLDRYRAAIRLLKKLQKEAM